MSQLLVEEEDQQDSFIWERSGLVNSSKANDAISELESDLKEATADLPLGKALTLLTSIHGHVFDKAVSVICESSPEEITFKFIEIPTVRALISIENYLTFSNNVGHSFKHIYDSLHEKFIKRTKSSSTKEQAMRILGYFVLNSRHKEDIQAYICQELYHPNKRSQLAVVALMQFLYTTYISQENDYCDLSALLIPPLVKIAEDYGDSPTLLVCSSCALALQLSGYIAMHLDDSPVEIEPSQKIMEVGNGSDRDKSSRIHHLSNSWRHADTLFHVMEKWNKLTSSIETAALKELHLIIQYAIRHFEDEDKQKSLIELWNLITTYLTPKSIVSEKPISLRKQKTILSSQHNHTIATIPLISIVKIILIVLLQKGRLTELYGLDRKSVLYNTEEEEIKDLFTVEYDNVIQSYFAVNSENIGDALIVQLVTQLKFLCSTNNIKSAELIQLIIERSEYTKDSTEWLTPLAMKQPESSICNLLPHVVRQDEKSKSSREFLEHLIAQNSSDIIDILESNLLPIVKRSDQACELLIQCMSYTDLPFLIQKLMRMTVTDVQRETMICMALISKALLVEKWKSNSILIYIDFVRKVKSQKGFVPPVKSNLADMKKLTPSNVTASKQDSQETVDEYDNQDLEKICNDLLIPIQLWSTKVDNESLRHSMNQLVYKSYGSPRDPIFINVWGHLSFALKNNHQLLWDVIEPCVEIMITQDGMTETVASNTDEGHLELLKINPMLALQTMPKEVFDVVQLPKSYIDLLSDKFKMIDIDPSSIKQSSSSSSTSKAAKLSIQLMGGLLSRSLDTAQLSPNTIQFTIALLTKIFCK